MPIKTPVPAGLRSAVRAAITGQAGLERPAASLNLDPARFTAVMGFYFELLAGSNASLVHKENLLVEIILVHFVSHTRAATLRCVKMLDDIAMLTCPGN